MKEDQEPTLDEWGAEVHPAFGLIGASRGSYGPAGAVLFDSDIRHNHTVTIRIKAASRKRDLHHDFIHGYKEFIEVELSEAQWASFVSSMNLGDGVPCTIRYTPGEMTPAVPYDPRLAQSMQETREAAHGAFDDIKAAMERYEKALTDKAPAAERREALSWLRSRINNAVPNVDFAGKQLIEQTENVVTRARADIEAFVTMKAAQLGIDSATLSAGTPFAIGSGRDDD